MANNFPLPEHFKPEKAGEVWRVEYEQLAVSARDWTEQNGISFAANDEFKIGLLLVDVQNTFCIPGFELYVGGRSGNGAVEDNQRLSAFIYKNIGAITRIIPTLDTHQVMQIFHSLFFVDENGKHPGPYTMISAEDIAEGRWRFNEALSANLQMSADDANSHLRHYTGELAKKGKFTHTVWPYHAMLGGIGHALVSIIEEAVFFHSIARNSQPDFQMKGTHPLTENYSVLQPEVAKDRGGNILVAKNEALLKRLEEYDAVIVAGQAKSHCVAWTCDDLMQHFQRTNPAFLENVYLLEDCASPVVIPEVIDFTDAAADAYDNFSNAGMHIVRTDTPITEWPGKIGRFAG